MKISAMTSLFRPHVGGVETMVEEMADHLKHEGHSLDVITKKWPTNLPEKETINGVEISRVRTANSDQEMLELAKYFRDNMDLIDQSDVLHMVGMRRPLPLFGVLLSRIHDKPVIGSVVGSEVPNPGSQDSYRIWREGLPYMTDAYRNADSLTAVSSAIKNYATTVMPDLDSRIKVLPVGIDYEGYAKVEPHYIDGIDNFILSLRRLEYSKGIDVLIKAYSKLKTESRINAHLLIAGDGPEKSNLENLAQELGLIDNSIRFLGSISLEQSIGLLKTASMTVVPSRTEGGGLINTEANAVGCPLITTRTGGISEYTTEQAAIFTNPGDVIYLAQAIDVVTHNKSLRDRMVEKGKQFAFSRRWENLIHSYIELYEKAGNSMRKELKIQSQIGQKILKILENEA